MGARCCKGGFAGDSPHISVVIIATGTVSFCYGTCLFGGSFHICATTCFVYHRRFWQLVVGILDESHLLLVYTYRCGSYSVWGLIVFNCVCVCTCIIMYMLYCVNTCI